MIGPSKPASSNAVGIIAAPTLPHRHQSQNPSQNRKKTTTTATTKTLKTTSRLHMALELKYSGTEEEGLNVVIHGASPETSHINFSTLENIADALTELPQRTRYAFEMYRLHGVPQKDIAKELGVSPTLVNFMIRDALVHCRKVSGSHSDTFARRV